MGAGKTTFARRLEREGRGLRFTHDEWMGRLYGDDPPADGFADRARRVSDLMEDNWSRCLTHGIDIILDSGFWLRAERDHVRARVAELGGRAVLYRLNCPDDLARRRVADRNRSMTGGLYIATATFDALRARFEPLSPEEGRVEIDGADATFAGR